MKGRVEFEFKPFTVPNFVIVEKGPDSPSKDIDLSFPINSLDDETFHAMVNEWVVAVYERAKKRQPATDR